MKHLFFPLFLLLTNSLFAQDIAPEIAKTKMKGSMYAYWGWNKSAYTTSDIHFIGNNYNFTLNNVAAKDRQNAFNLGLFLNPGTITIPQYNFRVGYFINEKYDISIGADHMKYVIKPNQTTNISGTISKTGTVYDGTYSNTPILVKPDLLLFEHTDGLNYLNTELRRNDQIFEKGAINLRIIEGAGFGVLVPRTNATLLNNPRNDQFHLAGFGLGAMVGLNVTFYNHLFIQGELKGGYINMPSVRTTMFKSDIAKQQFGFLQWNVVFGYKFYVCKK
jgi:hypothetical protein